MSRSLRPLPVIVLVLFVLLAAVVMTACGGSNPPAAPTTGAAEKPAAAQATDPLDKLYQAAKAEGQVSFWGPTDPEEMIALGDAFAKKFPGIKLNSFEITAGDLTTKIATEAQAGKVSTDVAEGSIDTIQPLVDRQLIQPYQDWVDVFKLPKEAVLQNGQLLAWYNLVHPISYNTKLLKAEEAPKSWEDLLDPKWKGKIIVEPRAKPFSVLGMAWGEDKMVDYMKKLAAQNPIFVKGGDSVVQQLAAGEAPLAVGAYSYKVALYKNQKGAPVESILVKPMGASQFTVFALKGAAHPNAAKLLVGWIASPEALQVLEKAVGKGSVLPGSGTAEAAALQKAGATVIVETAENSKQKSDLEEKAAKALGAVK